MITIGIDQSISCTGVSVVKEGETPLFYSIPTDSKRGIARLIFIRESMRKILKETLEIAKKEKEALSIAREGYSYSSVSSSIFQLCELGGIIDTLIFDELKNFPEVVAEYYIIPPNSWKLMVLGSGVIKKDTSYLLRAFEATGVRFDNDNIADSFMITLAVKKLKNYEFEKLSAKNKMGYITLSVRKKNKLTEKKISLLSKEDFGKSVENTLLEFLYMSNEVKK